MPNIPQVKIGSTTYEVKDGHALSMHNRLQYGGVIVVDDLNNAAANTIYRLQNTASSNLPPHHEYGQYWLVTLANATSDAGTPTFKNQYIIDHICGRVVAWREYSGGWKNWVELQNLKAYSTALTPTIDIDNSPAGIISFVSSGEIEGLPKVSYGGRNLLITTRISNEYLSDWDSQFIFAENAEAILCRVYYKGWNEWKKTNLGHPEIVEIGEGKNYTTLKEGFAAAISYKGAKVIVYPGEYDLATEFAEEIYNESGSGILLGNDMEVLFMPGAKVTCLMDVNRTWAYNNFEPFRVRSTKGNFILKGLNIVCKNTRYCVHDECAGSGTYYHRYEDCHMEQTDETTRGAFTQCIGGGLGEHGFIDIVGGWYKSKALYKQSHYDTVDDMQMPITYHNGNNVNAFGKICIRDVYLADKGYFRFGYYGPSVLKTPVEISGCHMYKEPYMMWEQWDSSKPINFELISYANEVGAMN